MSPEQENHLAFKGPFHGTHLHRAPPVVRCDRPRRLPDFGDLHAGFLRRPARGDAQRIRPRQGRLYRTVSEQPFYYDLVAWLRTLCSLHQLLKVPDAIEVSMREKAGTKIFFLLNHQNSPVRITFYKPMHDFLTERTFSGNYDLRPTASWCWMKAWRKRPRPGPMKSACRPGP